MYIKSFEIKIKYLKKTATGELLSRYTTSVPAYSNRWCIPMDVKKNKNWSGLLCLLSATAGNGMAEINLGFHGYMSPTL